MIIKHVVNGILKKDRFKISILLIFEKCQVNSIIKVTRIRKNKKSTNQRPINYSLVLGTTY